MEEFHNSCFKAGKYLFQNKFSENMDFPIFSCKNQIPKKLTLNQKKKKITILTFSSVISIQRLPGISLLFKDSLQFVLKHKFDYFSIIQDLWGASLKSKVWNIWVCDIWLWWGFFGKRGNVVNVWTFLVSEEANIKYTGKSPLKKAL